MDCWTSVFREYWHNEFTYFYKYKYSSAIAIAAFNTLLYTLPIILPLLAIRFRNGFFYDRQDIHSRLALWVSITPIFLALLEFTLNITNLVVTRPSLYLVH